MFVIVEFVVQQDTTDADAHTVHMKIRTGRSGKAAQMVVAVGYAGSQGTTGVRAFIITDETA